MVLKVCEAHIKTSGLNKRQLEIVSESECELCKMDEYFATHGYTQEQLRAMAISMKGKPVHDEKGNIIGKVIDAHVE